MKYVIGLVGAKGAGKTTVFGHLSEIWGAREIQLAKKLKDVCSRELGIDRDNFDDPIFKQELIDPPIFLDYTTVSNLYEAFNLTHKEGDNGRIVDFARFHVGKVLHTPREVAQYVGTEILRSRDSDIHCKHSLEGAELNSISIVTDIRFPNELEFFRKTAPTFILIYVKNTKAEMRARSDTHVSESHLPELAKQANFIIDNDGPLKALGTNLTKVISQIGDLP